MILDMTYTHTYTHYAYIYIRWTKRTLHCTRHARLSPFWYVTVLSQAPIARFGMKCIEVRQVCCDAWACSPVHMRVHVRVHLQRNSCVQLVLMISRCMHAKPGVQDSGSCLRSRNQGAPSSFSQCHGLGTASRLRFWELTAGRRETSCANKQINIMITMIMMIMTIMIIVIMIMRGIGSQIALCNPGTLLIGGFVLWALRWRAYERDVHHVCVCVSA